MNEAREGIWGKGRCKGTKAGCVQGTERRLAGWREVNKVLGSKREDWRC